MFPTERQVSEDKVEVAEMDGIEHLGQYVYEMTQAKVRSLKQGEGHLLDAEESKVYVGESEDEDAEGALPDNDAEPGSDEEDVVGVANAPIDADVEVEG